MLFCANKWTPLAVADERCP